MKWKRGQGADQIEDRRGQRVGVGGVAGVGGGLGIVGVIIALVLNSLGGGGGGGFDIPLDQSFPAAPAAGQDSPPVNDADAELADFVGFVVEDVQNSWEGIFAQAGQSYQPTVLVLFEEGTSTGCGQASSATGPFYCPADSKVYLDLGFFRELATRFEAPGDFAQAYVIAHEFGHHVQNVLGINEQVSQAQQSDPNEANELSIRLELQADCMAGIWAYTAYQQGVLEGGDLMEGLDAAAAVGDDRIQAESTGQVNPETWTHGSSEQRMEWFTTGYESGDLNRCDTFS